jgi:DNA polymerase III subunit delta'
LTPLNDILGQDIAKRIIRNSFNKNKLASTYLFYGSDGIGKWPAALALAALVNCEQPLTDEDGQAIDACGVCRNCRQIINLSFPELYLGVPIPPHKNEAEANELIQQYAGLKKQEPYKIITSSRQLTIPIDIARAVKRKTAIKPPENITRVILF